MDYIRQVIKPKPKECYRNSHLLCEAFPERILYCEGKTNVPIPIDHAFNKVGDAYIDITFEFALHENPSIYEYVTWRVRRKDHTKSSIGNRILRRNLQMVVLSE